MNHNPWAAIPIDTYHSLTKLDRKIMRQKAGFEQMRRYFVSDAIDASGILADVRTAKKFGTSIVKEVTAQNFTE